MQKNRIIICFLSCFFLVFNTYANNYFLAPVHNSTYALRHISIEEFEYCISIYKEFNPNNLPLKGFYPFSGPDLTTILLKTNAVDLNFLCPFQEDNFSLFGDPYSDDEIIKRRRESGYYDKHLFVKWDIGLWRLLEFEFKMLNIEPPFVFNEEFENQVRNEKIKKFVFYWKHPLDNISRKRTLTYIDGKIPISDLKDTLNVKELIPNFNKIPFDFVYVKGSFNSYSAEKISWFYKELLNKGYITSRSSYLLGIPFVSDHYLKSDYYLWKYKQLFPDHSYVEVNNEILQKLINIIPEEYGWRTLLFKYENQNDINQISFDNASSKNVSFLPIRNPLKRLFLKLISA